MRTRPRLPALLIALLLTLTAVGCTSGDEDVDVPAETTPAIEAMPDPTE